VTACSRRRTCRKAQENATKEGLDTIMTSKIKKRMRKKIRTLKEKAAKKPV